jgi:hypothetical protein
MPARSRLTRPFRALSAICCATFALQACGRSDVGDYYFDDELPGGGAVAMGGTNASGGASSTGGKKPSTGGSSTTGGSMAAGGSMAVGGSAQGGAFTMGGAATAGTSQGGFTQAGAGGTGQAVAITCGDQVCNSLVEACCATLGGFGCIPENQECSGATLNCGSSGDCGGNQVCCLRLVGEVSAASYCKDECAGMGPGRERELCTDDSDCGAERPRCRDTAFGVRVCSRF